MNDVLAGSVRSAPTNVSRIASITISGVVSHPPLPLVHVEKKLAQAAHALRGVRAWAWRVRHVQALSECEQQALGGWGGLDTTSQSVFSATQSSKDTININTSIQSEPPLIGVRNNGPHRNAIRLFFSSFSMQSCCAVLCLCGYMLDDTLASPGLGVRCVM